MVMPVDFRSSTNSTSFTIANDLLYNIKLTTYLCEVDYEVHSIKFDHPMITIGLQVHHASF